MDPFVKQVAEAMAARGFEVAFAERAAQAREIALAMIQPGQSVGIGGSMTIRELGLADALARQGHSVYWHWDAPGEQTLEQARQADVYLASANAVTRDGCIVNIDGRGNRVASLLQGPATVILIVGQQKLVDGGLNTAIARIRQQACPPNAKRLGLDTPCAHTGICNARACGEDCMCRAITMLEHPTRGRRVAVILVEETIGY